MEPTTLSDEQQVPPPAVVALLNRYVHVLDGDRLEEWPALFTARCMYRITTRANVKRGFPASIMLCETVGMLKDRVVSVQHANVFEAHCYRHIVSNTQVIGRTGNEFRLRSNFVVYRSVSERAPELFCMGEYLDRIVSVDGAPRFAERIAVLDHSVIKNLIAIPL